MGLPEKVQTITADYLAAIDEVAPGLVEGLYLVGSLALDDYRPGQSDIDFVAVTAGRLVGDTIVAVRRVHRELARRHRVDFDGPYVTWADLASDPRKSGPGVHVLGRGRVTGSTMRERHPVTWHSLAQSGIVVRGPVIDDIGVWTDPTGLADSVRENVDTYWRGWHRVGSRSFSRRGLLLLTDGGPAWCVLGVSRLHYTLTTKRIASKGAAGVYAREVFSSRWHRIVDESLRLHRQEGGPSRYGARRARRRDVLDFLDHVIKDAGQLPRG